MIIFAIILVALVLLYPVADQAFRQNNPQLKMESSGGEPPQHVGENRLFLPTGPSTQVVHHQFYSLGYEEDWEQPRWVAYELSPKQVKDRSAKRRDEFRPDPKVKTGSADREDYRNSGYSRGHLVPAGDMSFDETAMSETFFYSNMSPQLVNHNGAVWRELEETSREWIAKKGLTYIVSGPIIGNNPKRIGHNQVAIPEAFYRVMLTNQGEGLGFIIPHEKQTKPLDYFAVSIDDVEAQTGLDFFPELEELSTPEVESRVDKSSWPINDRRYQLRLTSWNKQQ